MFGTILRLVLAAAGIAFVATQVTWQDTVTFPAGYTQPGIDHAALEPGREYHVSTADDGQLLLMDAPYLTLDPADVTPEPDTPTYQPAVATMLRQAQWTYLLGGLVLLGVIYPIQAGRWKLLLAAAGLVPTFLRCFKLNMIGTFFNICMPGSTGGDVMKAYYAAKGSGKRGPAVMSVIVDRGCGLVGLVLLGSAVGITQLDDPRLKPLIVGLWIALGALTVGLSAYLLPSMRRLLRIEQIINRLPGKALWAKVDSAAALYGHAWGRLLLAMAVSVVVHTAIVFAMALAGYALGMKHDLATLLVILPIVMLTQAIPLFPMGLGVADAAAFQLLGDPALATNNQIAGMMIVQRLYFIAYALVGAVILIRGNLHLHDAVDPNAPAPPSSKQASSQQDAPEQASPGQASPE
ncbi:MAG: lysylphosphatidylglycerol synthase transmembrane domain-containing protein [Planctomycetota bacterium]